MNDPRSTAELAEDFKDCIACLNRHRVRYVLVGGYAVGIHGVIRATGDIDFFYEPTQKNVDRLCDALGEFGAPEQLIDRDFLVRPDAVTQIGNEPLRIDLLSSISGPTFKEVWDGAERLEIDGHKLRVIGLTELRQNKTATGRAKDKADLRRLK